MSIDPINIGGAANDGNGQTLRSGGAVINANFAELDTRTTAAQAKAEQGVADAGTAQAAAEAAQAKADAAIPGSAAGTSVAQLVNGVVPALQLPSYVDDVLEFPTLANFPATGETGKIYIAINDGDSPSNPTRQYRWSGTAYVMIPSSPGSTDQVAEGTTNLYHTADRVRATLLTGLGSLVNSAIQATDSLLQAFAKLQGQINGKLGASETAADSSKLGGQLPSFYTAAMTGATGTDPGTKGLVPAPPAGAAVRVLSSLGTWISQATGGVWGGITGTLSAQTDLQTAFDAQTTATSAVAAKLNGVDSGYLTVTAGALNTISYSLPSKPTSFDLTIKATVANNGFSIGDEVPIHNGCDYGGVATAYGVQIQEVTNTGLKLWVGSTLSAFTINKTTGVGFSPSPTQWQIAIRAKIRG